MKKKEMYELIQPLFFKQMNFSSEDFILLPQTSHKPNFAQFLWE